MNTLLLDRAYKDWLVEVKQKIRSSQLRSAIAANVALIEFYWDLGRMIVEKQEQSEWGDKIIEQLSFDLKSEFPDLKGLSRSNLSYAKQFYNFYFSHIVQQAVGQTQFIQQLVGQIPWGHNILIFTKVKNISEACFYISKTIASGWSRDNLAIQIKSNLFSRVGKSITNFKQTLPQPLSDLAQQTLKDPYIFDFLTLTAETKERDIETQLVQQVTKFLLELGKGFAFVGRQYHLEIGGSDYYIDLLFYHIHLKCYVVIELKNTKFIPEYAGKLNFYLSAVDSLLKQDSDISTIGILLCRDKNNLEAEFALRDIGKPMGVSEFQFTEILPENLKGSLPTVEELEAELKKLNHD
jgi:predicted nuclease of restriction endonuclease-like (RecB) superfamily